MKNFFHRDVRLCEYCGVTVEVPPAALVSTETLHTLFRRVIFEKKCLQREIIFNSRYVFKSINCRLPEENFVSIQKGVFNRPVGENEKTLLYIASF